MAVIITINALFLIYLIIRVEKILSAIKKVKIEPKITIVKSEWKGSDTYPLSDFTYPERKYKEKLSKKLNKKK